MKQEPEPVSRLYIASVIKAPVFVKSSAAGPSSLSRSYLVLPRATPPPTLPLHCTTNETMAEDEEGPLMATGISEAEVVALATRTGTPRSY